MAEKEKIASDKKTMRKKLLRIEKEKVSSMLKKTSHKKLEPKEVKKSGPKKRRTLERKKIRKAKPKKRKKLTKKTLLKKRGPKKLRLGAVEEASTVGEITKGFEKLKPTPTKNSVVSIEGLPTYNMIVHGPMAVFPGVPGYRELERYWVDEPFAFVVVLENPETNTRLYYLVEPVLTESEQDLLDTIVERMRGSIPYVGSPADKEKFLAKKVMGFLRTLEVSDPKLVHKIVYFVRRSCLGYGEIDPLIKDPNIEDISCNGLNTPLFLYHRKYYNIPTNLTFTDAQRLNSFVISLAERSGKMISFGRPTVDGTLPDGSRLQATLGDEVTTKGSTFTIRKFAKEPFTPVHLVKYGTYSPEMLAYLWLMVENKKNLMFIGETACGKTSSLNAISLFIPPDAKIVSLEETRELTFYQENWIPNVTREAVGGEVPITLYDLLRQALRQRPEVLVVGEVRGQEGLVLFQAMSTGHTCYSTLHANTVEDAVNRLEGAPINVPHNMLAALDVACFQSISYLGKRRVRRTNTIVEFAGLDPATGGLRINEVFRWDPVRDKYDKTGDSMLLREIMQARGWSQADLERELTERAKLIKYLADRDIVRYEDVAPIMRNFYANPEKLLKQLKEVKKTGRD